MSRRHAKCKQALMEMCCTSLVISIRKLCLITSPGNLPMLRIVAARTLNLILLDAAAREKHGTYSGATVEWRTSLECHATLFLCSARAAESRSIRLRVHVWEVSFQSFYYYPCWSLNPQSTVATMFVYILHIIRVLWCGFALLKYYCYNVKLQWHAHTVIMSTEKLQLCQTLVHFWTYYCVLHSVGIFTNSVRPGWMLDVFV
jgi:hypothetical protein